MPLCLFDLRPCRYPCCAICAELDCIKEGVGSVALDLTTPELAGLAELLHEKLQRTKPFAGEHPDIFLLRTNHWRVMLRKIAEEYDRRPDKTMGGKDD
jgi:hypothetical protein